MIAGLFFYMFALVLIISAVAVVTVRQPVTSVLWLILCFFNAAGLFLLAGAEFLAFLMLIVYVGAVAVLFLFVVMMLDIKAQKVAPMLKRYKAAIAGVGSVLLAQIFISLTAWPSDVTTLSADKAVDQVENTRALGRILYTDFGYPFQVAGVILLVAMIGAIVLTFRQRPGVKKQKLWEQFDRRKEDVLEIRKVKSGEGVS